MKSKTKAGIHRFPLNLLYSGNYYYLDRIAKLEKLLARRPRTLQLDLIGEGEISAEWALLLRELLGGRSPRTRLITNARSTLKNGSALVWLLGDERRLAPHARLFFRKATVTEEPEGAIAKVWNADEVKYSESDADPDEIAHVRLLEFINEYLPVKELTGKMIDEATLRQFGLMENEKLDQFLVSAFSGQPVRDEKSGGEQKVAASKSPSVPTQN